MKQVVTHLASTLFALFLASSVQAAQSEWLVAQGAKLRLISLPSTGTTPIRAGLQIELEKGWKTYWRSPGFSGLPPQISFSSSMNVESATLSYPAPKIFYGGGDASAGYKSSVTLPIQIKPLFGSMPTLIKAEGVIGVCSDVCVPIPFQLSLEENGTGGTSFAIASLLNEAEARLPGRARDDQAVAGSQFISGDEPHLMIETKVPETSTEIDLFVEGPSNWYLSPAKLVQREGSKAFFKLDLADAPADADPSQTDLLFTLVADGRGIEQTLKPAK